LVKKKTYRKRLEEDQALYDALHGVAGQTESGAQMAPALSDERRDTGGRLRGGGCCGGGRVVSRRTAVVGRGRQGRPQVAGRADGQRRRRVVRRPGHAAVRVPLIADAAAAAGHGVVAAHDWQRQTVLVVTAGHTEIHRHRAILYIWNRAERISRVTYNNLIYYNIILILTLIHLFLSMKYFT